MNYVYSEERVEFFHSSNCNISNNFLKVNEVHNVLVASQPTHWLMQSRRRPRTMSTIYSVIIINKLIIE